MFGQDSKVALEPLTEFPLSLAEVNPDIYGAVDNHGVLVHAANIDPHEPGLLWHIPSTGEKPEPIPLFECISTGVCTTRINALTFNAP
jgi:hypothetical protein